MEMTALQPGKWNLPQKILFRFVAVYIFCYIGLEEIMELTGGLFDPLIGWIAKYLLHISYPITVKPNGSGDTTYNYVQEFLFLVLSLITCIIWSVSDRKRGSYNKMLYWLQVLVRYYLAYVLLGYGYAKIFKSQFPEPSLQRLMQPYGQSSPMGLAWTFLGFSSAYNFFIGFFEAIGGVLMIFRRTTIFGACIAATVITNIVLINFCYDVPVKLFSSNLLFMALFIILSDSRRVLNFFILNKDVRAADLNIVFKKRKWRITRIVLKSLFVFYAVGYVGYIYMGNVRAYYRPYPKSPLYGIYNVETFAVNNDTIPPMAADTTRWRKVVIYSSDNLQLYKMNDTISWRSCIIDTLAKTLIINQPGKNEGYHMSYATEGKDIVILRARIESRLRFIRPFDSLYIKLRRTDEHDLLLMNRGFHWINEYPNNM